MESKLLQAAKALNEYLIDELSETVGDIHDKVWLPFTAAIREAEQVEAAPTPPMNRFEELCRAISGVDDSGPVDNWIKMNPIGEHGKPYYLVTEDYFKQYSELNAAPTPAKPDPWACCHGEDFGRCGAEICGWRGMAQSKEGPHFYPITSCPCDDRQKPAPARRTKLDVAVEAYNKTARMSKERDCFREPMCAALEAIGENPDEVEG